MRSRSLLCAALVTVGLGASSPRTFAADSKAKGQKKASTDADNINKTLQWEDKVMGPDDKRSELDKILKAQAINKVAQEKAERDKEKAAKEQAAREAREAAAPKNQKRGGEVALPSLSDEDSASKKPDKTRSVDVSPKLDTVEAAAPPPPSKPADDKFIDKLLKEEGAGKKKKNASADDKSLLDLLATDKTATGKGAPKTKGRKGDVDNLLQEADKEPAPIPKIKHETPEWEKPEIQSAPSAAPVVVKPAPKRDDGIIHVVQGAATPAHAVTTTTSTANRTAPTASSRKAASATPASSGHVASWNDPFADSAPRKVGRHDESDDRATSASASRKATAARSTDRANGADDGSWDDPFDAKRASAKGAKTTASSRRAAAHSAKSTAARSVASGGWKDPFTQGTSARSSNGPVAMRERGKDEAAAGGGSGRHRWGLIKKHR